MARTATIQRARCALVPALLRYVEARGGDVEAVARRASVDVSVQHHDDVIATAEQVRDALDGAAHELGEPHLGLRLVDELRFRTYRFAELAALASPTVRAGLVEIARSSVLSVPGVEVLLEDVTDGLVLRARTVGQARGLGPVVNEYVLGSLLAHAHRAAGRAIVARRVWFAHARPRNLEAVCDWFKTRDLAFGAEDSGFQLDATDADAASVGSDARLLATVESLAADERAAAQNTFVTTVATCIAAKLPDTRVDAIAKELHLTVRTLQRRLDEEQTSYSNVLDAAREARAREWLDDPQPTLADIAERLGFADLATFGRAFKRWTGMPPGAYRRRK